MYSQHGEDDLFFNYITKKEKGTYIDIGAGYPKNISNTYMLYEMGWSGLLIEPCPILTPALKTERPRDVLYEGALLDYEGTVKIVTKKELAITEKAWIFETHKERAVRDGFTIQEFIVHCTTLPKLLEKYPQFMCPDIVSIDVDGNEGEILSTIDFTQFKPQLITIEYGLRQIDHRKVWGHYLDKFYKITWDNGSDCFYLRSK